ncbi:hypothetical protein A3F06_03440 [candidate division TM6 bacterium RIFCSPHIGHO2_12_FULL_36_22]|nr:MAG: hypothetical protein A3F06_03440 [candidate division TM6 bacterium RIFCSPHIGHO2_12_FULL_36_22]
MKKLMLISLLSLSTLSFAESGTSVESNVEWILNETLTKSLASDITRLFASQPNLTQQEQQEAEKVMGQIFDKLFELMKQNVPAITNIYLKYFTAEEIEQLVSLYRSELGQKLILVQGSMMNNIAEFLQPQIINIINDLSSDFAKSDMIIA